MLIISEFDGATQTMLRRYVHGDQVDEPWVQYNGSTVGSHNIRYLHANHQGSIIAHSVNNGVLINKLSYDSYGIPGADNEGRFGYTGQLWFKELGLNHYKARIYSPKLGRFLQTDPIFYADQMNMYAYVGNDPVNMRDPTGEYGVAGFLIGVGLEVARQAVTGELKSGSALANIGKASAAGLAGAAGMGLGRGIAALSTSIVARASGNAIAGAGVGAANQVVNNAIDGKNVGDGVGKAAALGAVGGALGSAVGDKIDAAAAAAKSELKMGSGNLAENNLAQGIEETTAKSNVTSAFAPPSVSGGESLGAVAGGAPPAGDSVSQCKQDKSC